jgi:hypothetical protein
LDPGKIKNDYKLNIKCNADTSPPPEISDINAILHGAIPVRNMHPHPCDWISASMPV